MSIHILDNRIVNYFKFIFVIHSEIINYKETSYPYIEEKFKYYIGNNIKMEFIEDLIKLFSLREIHITNVLNCYIKHYSNMNSIFNGETYGIHKVSLNELEYFLEQNIFYLKSIDRNLKIESIQK